MIWRYLDSLQNRVVSIGVKPRKIKARTKKRKFPLWLLLLILLPLLFIKVPIEQKERYTVQVPYEQKATGAAIQPIITDECTTTEYDWSFSWGDWVSDGSGRISPTYFLSNNERESASYTIQFAYFDGNLYPYETYQGKNYDSVELSLPWRAAAMIAQQQTYTLRGKQTIEITQFVIPQDPSGNYWVYADVQAPTRTQCVQVRKYPTDLKEATTKYRDEQRIRTVTENVSLWKLPLQFFN